MTDETLINVELEAEFLGLLMQENKSIDTALDLVDAEDFGEPAHGRIFAAIAREASLGRPANPVTLKAYFDADEAIKSLGGAKYIFNLTAHLSMTPVRPSAERIRDLAQRRRMRGGLIAAADACLDHESTTAEIINFADNAITQNGKDEIHQPTGGECFDELINGFGEGDYGVTCGIIPDLDDAIGALRPGQMVIVAGRPGMGKAQPLTAKVMTMAGWKLMGELAIGDHLASIDGAESEVTGIFPQGVKQIYRVTLSDGRSTECCGDHLWRVRYRDWPEARVLSTNDVRTMLLRKRYRNRLSIDLFDGDFGGRILPIDPWLFGFLLGDGSICGGRVRFSSKDLELVKAVSDALPDGLSVRFSSTYNYNITGGARGGRPNPLMDDLRRLGVFETRSHDKFIPESYLSANRADRIDLLRGLMDSDGWAETFGAIRFGTASERLANDVCYLIRSIGGICSIRARSTTYTYKGERKQGRTSYTCRIRLKNPAEVFTLDRKIERVGRIKNTLRLNFTSIEPARFDQVQCISVSHPQRLYVTDDFIITHNTAVAVSYALGAAQNGHGVLFATLEMSSRELAGRMAADMCYRDGRGIPYGAIRKGSLDEWQRKQVTRAGQHMCTLPFQVVEKGNLTTGRLNMLIRRHKRRMEAKGKKLELVVVDYLQLMRPDRRGSKYEDVSEVSMALKAMAMDHGVAIMALAQLSRLVEQRPDKRPQLSDLRDSGQIEQDADVVLFLLREEYYLRLTEPDESDPKRAGWEASMDTARNRIEFIVAKRRNGETGTAIGQFHGAFQAVRGFN